jgi:hypothetical protein
MTNRLMSASKHALVALLAGGVLAGCSSGVGAGVEPARPQMSHMSSGSVPIPARIELTAVNYSETQPNITMTLTYGSTTINATCQRLDVSFAAHTFHSDRLCTATSGGTGTLSIRWRGNAQPTPIAFLYEVSGSGNIYAGTQDFTNLRGQFGVTCSCLFGDPNFPIINHEVWTGQVGLAPF